jgi:hypothetical protein
MSATINPDLARERANATIDLANMKQFLGEFIYTNKENYFKMLKYSLFIIFYYIYIKMNQINMKIF